MCGWHITSCQFQMRRSCFLSISGLFFFPSWVAFCCTDRSWFIHPQIDGHLYYFQFHEMMNKSARNIHRKVAFCDVQIHNQYLGIRLLGCIIHASLNLGKMLNSKMTMPFYSLSSNLWDFQWFHLFGSIRSLLF